MPRQLVRATDAGHGTDASWAAPVRATQALSFLAREVIELLTGPLAGRMRECAGDDCPLVFVDSSRPDARRGFRALRARCAAEP